MAYVPYKVVLIAAFDAVLPFSAEQSVHFPGKKIRKRICAHGEGDGRQHGAALGLEAAGRIGVHLDPDLQRFAGVQRQGRAPRRDDNPLLQGIGLEKRGFDGGL